MIRQSFILIHLFEKIANSYIERVYNGILFCLQCLKSKYKNKLFEILEQKNITKTELRENVKISTATLAKLSKNELVAMKVIENICNFLNCQPGDIMEMQKEVDKSTLLYRLREEKQIRLKGEIYHQSQIKFAYNCNHMEGSRLDSLYL